MQASQQQLLRPSAAKTQAITDSPFSAEIILLPENLNF
jgi:hypothetical protein